MKIAWNAISGEVCLQFSRFIDGSVAQLAALRLLDDIGKINRRFAIADLDVGFGLGVGEVGDLIVFSAGQPMFLEEVAWEDVVNVTPVEDDVGHSDIFG